MSEIIIDDFFKNEEKPYKIKNWEIFIWILIFLASLLMKLQHWTGGTILLCISTAGFSGFSFFGLTVSNAKDKKPILYSLISSLWILYIIYGVFFNNGHPFNLYGIATYGVTGLIVYFIHLIFYRRKIRKASEID